MRTIASAQCSEFHQLHDFVEILESFLPADESCPVELEKIAIWRDKLARLGECELDGGIGPYESMLSLANEPHGGGSSEPVPSAYRPTSWT